MWRRATWAAPRHVGYVILVVYCLAVKHRSISQKTGTKHMHTMHTCSQITADVSAKMFVSLHEGQNNIIVSVCVCVCLCFCLYLCVHTRPSLNGERFKLN